jgi:hypothetical protein
VNQTLGVRLKTVILSSFLSERRENNTLYIENSVDARTKEVTSYLPTQLNTKRGQVLKTM